MNELKCIYCGGNILEPDHDRFCDGKQGGRDDDPIPPLWFPPFNPNTEAFDGLTPEQKQLIRGAVTKDMAQGLVGCLDTSPRFAEIVRRCMVQYPWFPSEAQVGSQLRKIRSIRDAAVSWQFPVCASNTGYFLGTWEQVYQTAARAKGHAIGGFKRASVLEYLADRMRRAS